jgi:hypothetical protein
LTGDNKEVKMSMEVKLWIVIIVAGEMTITQKGDNGNASL